MHIQIEDSFFFIINISKSINYLNILIYTNNIFYIKFPLKLSKYQEKLKKIDYFDKNKDDKTKTDTNFIIPIKHFWYLIYFLYLDKSLMIQA